MIIKHEGVLGASIIRDTRLAELECQEEERLLDQHSQTVSQCPNCSGALEHECPSLEFEDHDELQCAYECSGGTVSCHCTHFTQTRVESMDYWRRPAPPLTSTRALSLGHIEEDNEEWR
jgi:hypothetical protein